MLIAVIFETINSFVNKYVIGKKIQLSFFNQVGVKHAVGYTPTGDFWINHKLTFEVGGKNKTFTQVKNLEQAYLAIDGVETGLGNKIPLWMFGLMIVWGAVLRIADRRNALERWLEAAPAAHEDAILLGALGHEPVALDELLARVALDPGALGARLLDLELAGFVTRLPGGRVQRIWR